MVVLLFVAIAGLGHRAADRPEAASAGAAAEG
jgi:hypothetical protein